MLPARSVLFTLAGFLPQTSSSEEIVDIVEIDRVESISDYSDFLLLRLIEHVSTSHVLIVQWDGFVLDRHSWDPEFLEYDYIGAVWPQFDEGMSVGNGGFSLRSKRLLNALQDPDIIRHSPEDICICHTNRRLLEDRYCIKFAPPEVAARFSFERSLPSQRTLGFHGLFNLISALPRTYKDEIRSIPGFLLTNVDAIDLAAGLRRTGRWRDRVLAWRIAFNVARYRPNLLGRLLRRWIFG